MYLTNKLHLATLILTCSTLIACGGGGGGGGGSDGGSGSPGTYTAGGTLSGLGTGKSVVLQNNAGDDLALSSNGAFTFNTALGDAATYAVTMLTQPSAQNCMVTNGTGTVSGANVNDVTVDCVDQQATEPAERFVISGNNDGTLSVFRSNNMTGYATAHAYFPTDGFAIQDMVYDQGNGRIVMISANSIYIVAINADTGSLTAIDDRPTSGNSSHLTLNSDGSAVYVASGTSTNQAVDMFTIGDTGVLSPVNATSLTIDPDYIKLDPVEAYLYVVSRTDDQILIFSVNVDNTLSASPATINTDTNPTSLGFNTTGTKAYMTRQNNSDNLVVYDVASNGGLTQSTTFSNSNSPIDMVLNTDGSQLYVLDSNNTNINRYSVDSSGTPTFVDSTNVSFTPTDITLGHTGEQLFLSHSEDGLVSTIDIDAADGSLGVAGWVRSFNSANTIAAIGANGALVPTATYLLAPDDSGLVQFSTATDGMLTLVNTLNLTGALIDGEVAVNYQHGLLFAAGEDAAANDLLASYTYNPTTGSTTAVDTITVTPSATASFQRIKLGRSGRVMYVLDEDIFSSTTIPAPRGSLLTYAYSSNGTINTTAIDTDNVGQGPENISLHPAGRYLYSVNSFGDNITLFRISPVDGSLTQVNTVTPGGTGAGQGRPIDIRFHPNGRYAYVSQQDDGEIDRYEVGSNGFLNNISRLTPPQDNGVAVEPGPIVVHPNGMFVYNGERNVTNGVSVYAVNSSNYSLTHQSRVSATGNPTWLEIDPQGRFLYVRYSDESIQVFSIDATTGDLTSIQQGVAAGNSGGFLPTLTLVAPLQ